MDAPLLHDLAAAFSKEIVSSPALVDEWQSRRRRMDRAQRLCQLDNILELSEAELQELFLDSSAFRFWRDGPGEFRRRIDRVGIEGLKSTLRFLIERAADGLSPDDLKEIRSNTGIGLLLATELAAYRYPDRCWIFSPRITLPALCRLGVDLRGRVLTGQKSEPYLYALAREPIEQVRKALEEAGLPDANFVLADLFLWWIWTRTRDEARTGDQDPPTEQAAATERGQATAKKQTTDQRQATGRRSKLRKESTAAGVLKEDSGAYRCRPLDIASVLHESLGSRGLSFTRWQLAAFYTALQVKGFVILSGISGTGKTRLAQQMAALLSEDEGPASNYLFLPVRPDWRDSRSLLGYYNPLTQQYEWTAFLRFLVHAAAGFRKRDGRPYFILLDEMNLARVEYYFADLLSVLESGRDADGWTRESLRFLAPAAVRGDRPPASLALPPNLYLVGTVNVDETTHAFSPKVLDRAFVLELADVDFHQSRRRQPGCTPTGSMKRELVRQFTGEGRFPRTGESTPDVPVEDTIVRRLQSLANRLRPHDLHFGYRVFDEIVTFLYLARLSGIFGAGGAEDALDAAIRMKVLPRFHGSRGRLERPVRGLLAWCLDPDEPDDARIEQALRPVETAGIRDAAVVVEREISRLPFRYPVTAARAVRMLQALYTEGFSAFG